MRPLYQNGTNPILTCLPWKSATLCKKWLQCLHKVTGHKSYKATMQFDCAFPFSLLDSTTSLVSPGKPWKPWSHPALIRAFAVSIWTFLHYIAIICIIFFLFIKFELNFFEKLEMCVFINNYVPNYMLVPSKCQQGITHEIRFLFEKLIVIYSSARISLSNIIYFLKYSEPLLQWQHFFPKTLPLKWICCCKEYFMSRLICKKGLVLFLFPHRTFVLDIC